MVQMNTAQVATTTVLNCASESHFTFFNSAEKQNGAGNKWLTGEAVLAEKASSLNSLRGFTLLTTHGDPMETRALLQISSASLTSLLETLGVLPFYLRMYATETYNMSHHVQYEENSPVAIAILLRMPRTSQSINIAFRIRLHDLSSVCFLSAADKTAAEYFHDRCLQEADLLAKHPIFLLALVFEERYSHCFDWTTGVTQSLNEIETFTGMVPDLYQRTQVAPTKMPWLEDYDNQLTQLHHTATALHHCGVVFVALEKFARFSTETATMVESLRANLGLPPAEEQDRARYQEHVKFYLGKSGFMHDRVGAVTERLRTQINVVFSLVTQRDSNINLTIAEDSNRVAILAARDSETMKTITILTLFFLPTSLVTSIWSTGLVHLDDSSSWKVYLGVSMSLTATVFVIWLVYLRICGIERQKTPPLRIPGVGYVREGKIVDRRGHLMSQSQLARQRLRATSAESEEFEKRTSPWTTTRKQQRHAA